MEAWAKGIPPAPKNRATHSGGGPGWCSAIRLQPRTIEKLKIWVFCSPWWCQFIDTMPNSSSFLITVVFSYVVSVSLLVIFTIYVHIFSYSSFIINIVPTKQTMFPVYRLYRMPIRAQGTPSCRNSVLSQMASPAGKFVSDFERFRHTCDHIRRTSMEFRMFLIKVPGL